MGEIPALTLLGEMAAKIFCMIVIWKKKDNLFHMLKNIPLTDF